MPIVTLTDDGRVGLASTSAFPTASRACGVTAAMTSMPWTSCDRHAQADPPEDLRLGISSRSMASTSSSSTTGHWYTYAFATGKTTDITGGCQGRALRPGDVEHARIPRRAWGIAGWTKGDRSVLIYDRFDVWELDPDGRAPAGGGHRLRRASREHGVPPGRPRARSRRGALHRSGQAALLPRLQRRSPRRSGFYTDRLGVTQAPEKIVMGDLNYGTPQKARGRRRCTCSPRAPSSTSRTSGSARTSRTLTKITDANPWQKEYNWGTAELVTLD